MQEGSEPPNGSENVPPGGGAVRIVDSAYKLTPPGQAERLLALFFLVGLVIAVLFVSAILTVIAAVRGGDEKLWGIAREFLEITLSPLIGLLGVAIAYYYSSK